MAGVSTDAYTYARREPRPAGRRPEHHREREVQTRLREIPMHPLGRRVLAVATAVVLASTSCGLPLAGSRPESHGPCGCGTGCRCSLASILTGKCCCARRGGGVPATVPQSSSALRPCCAARLKKTPLAPETAAAGRCCRAQAPGTCDAEPADRETAPPDGAADTPAVGCDCGSQPQNGWIVMAEPRLLWGTTGVVHNRAISSWLRVESQVARSRRVKPAVPPPRDEPV